MKKLNLFNIVFILLLFMKCAHEKSNKMVELNKLEVEKWESLSLKKIYFAHQSVGSNLIEGISMHMSNDSDVKLKIVEGNGPNLFSQAVFAHSKSGKNHDPISKIDAFVNTMDGGIGELVDIAGLKFCFVDFKKSTDIEEVFNYYKTKILYLKRKYPTVIFFHFTVPLSTNQGILKSLLKKVLGRETRLENNYARMRFNQLVLKEFDKGRVFDIAEVESTYPDGKREFSFVGSEKVYSMVKLYSSDGGHLSEYGKDLIGGQFLLFLADLK